MGRPARFILAALFAFFSAGKKRRNLKTIARNETFRRALCFFDEERRTLFLSPRGGARAIKSKFVFLFVANRFDLWYNVKYSEYIIV